MSKLRIFIEGRELDTLDSVTVPIVKQFEELSDPTVICNDYSKTVTVPLSKNNNEVFGHAYNPNKRIVESDGTIPLVGIYFDPFKKLDCRLVWGDDVFFVGYAKMLKVSNSGYEVTINGELGKIFQELQKITFDKRKYETQEDIDKYWIDGSKYVNTQINKELVNKCWNSEQDDYTLRETTDSAYDITDIIGFIANNSYSNDFDYKTVEVADGTNKSISDVLGGDFETNTGYSRESVIGDGLTPVQMSQFRSYEQIPFIYWNKYWQIFQTKAEELTGYTWDLDSWFSTTNANYSKIAAVLLQRDSIVSETEKVSDSTFSLSSEQQTVQYSVGSTNSIAINASGEYVSNNKLTPEDGELLIHLIPQVTISVKNPSDYAATDISFSAANPTGFRLEYYYGSTQKADYIFCNDSSTAEEKFKGLYPTATIIRTAAISVDIPSQGWCDFVLKAADDMYIRVWSAEGSQKLTCKLTPLYTSTLTVNTCPLIFKTTLEADPFVWADSVGTVYSQNYSGELFWQKTLFRSDSVFTLNDICNFDFTNILDYCKRFRILIYADSVKKKLVFTRSYFKDYTITDMTDKIDKTNTFDIETPIFDDKYVLFGYKQNDTLLGSGYKNMNTYAYGAKRLDTNYQFNTDTTTLFEKTPETILYSPTYLYWGELLENAFAKRDKLCFWLYNNNYLECRDSSGKTVDMSGAYFFPTKTKIDRYWVVRVTDDSDNMRLADNYYNYSNPTGDTTDYWTSPELALHITGTYPEVYHTCLFEKPKKNYTSVQNYWDRVVSTVYSSFWDSYINERYSVQNKKVTTYIRISPQQFSSFKFNQLWKIGNQIYIVNKIYDYDITSDKPTKVDLITIQNIEAYKN